jgi:hypothetical protein
MNASPFWIMFLLSSGAHRRNVDSVEEKLGGVAPALAKPGQRGPRHPEGANGRSAAADGGNRGQHQSVPYGICHRQDHCADGGHAGARNGEVVGAVGVAGLSKDTEIARTAAHYR